MPTLLPLLLLSIAASQVLAFSLQQEQLATRSLCERQFTSSEVSAVPILRQRGKHTVQAKKLIADLEWTEMEKEHIKLAMLRQELTFRQQVHELHRVYRVQRQLMMQMQLGKASADSQTRSTMKVDCQQWHGNSGEKKVMFEDFDLELTLATGVGKQEKPTNSDSEATMSSSTSAESESGRQFVPNSNVTVRFQNESNRHDDPVMQSPWLYHCLSLKMT